MAQPSPYRLGSPTHLCGVQAAEAVVLQGSKESFNACHVPAPSNNEVPSCVIVMEIFIEAGEECKRSGEPGLKTDCFQRVSFIDPS